jgi:uncharacterized protein (UPF0179 family)
MGIRKHIRLLSVLLVGLAGAGLLTVGLGLTPLSGSVFGSNFGFGPKGDFSLSSGSPATVPQGHAGTISITVTGVNHLSGDVSITVTLATSTSTPPVVASSQSSVKLNPDSTATSSTTLGYYNITVQGKTSTLSHSITVSAQVTPPPPPPTPDFSLSSNPSWLTASQGSYVTAVLTVSSVLSYSGNVALTATVSPSGTNSPSVSLNLTRLLLPAAGANATTLVVNTSNATAAYYSIAITGISGSLTHTLYITLSVTPFTGTESLYVQSVYINTPTNATLTIQNTGSVTSTLVAYYVTDFTGAQYSLTSWNGPVITPSAVATATILIGASCSRCVLTGAAFVFTQGNTYQVTLVTRYNNQFMVTFTIPTVSREALNLENFAFNSSTSVILDIRNTGTATVQLVSYYVKDSSGNQYALVSYSGPTIAPNQVAVVTVRIGSSCPNCTLSGTPFTFTVGSSYTIVFVTARNNQFSFTVTR